MPKKKMTFDVKTNGRWYRATGLKLLGKTTKKWKMKKTPTRRKRKSIF